VYEIDKTVPIKVSVAKPYSVSGNIPLYLDVKFRGVGWSLIRLFTSLNPEFNYSVIPRLNEQSVILTKQYLSDNLGLSQNLSITDVYPESLLVRVDNYEEKFVKLVPELRVDYKSGYQLVGKPILEPDSILVGGSPRVLGGLKQLRTQPVVMHNVSSNVTSLVYLSDSLSNIVWKPETAIKLNLNIELTAEKEFQGVPIRITGVPDDKEVLLIPENLTLQIKGGVNQLSSIDQTKIIAGLIYHDIFYDTTGSVMPRFILPDGTSIIFSKPEKVQYVIKKKY
jgi:hypothetical protein